jgi:FkbM family methyltransferase
MKNPINPKTFYKLLPWYLNPFLHWGGSVKTDRIRKELKCLGIVLSLDLGEYLDRMYALCQYDRKSLDFLDDKLTDCTFFVDLGANLGFYSLALAKRNENLVCILVEPDPYSVNKILRNLELNSTLSSRLVLERVAVGDRQGNLDLMINTVGNRGGSSVVIDQRKWTKTSQNIIVSVDTITLLDLLRKYSIDETTPWCLKIDIEGYEYTVLHKFIQDCRNAFWPKAIVAEWTGRGITSDSGKTPIDLLLDNGYTLAGQDSLNYLLIRK